jgi:ubiquinone/menaquinone biosynthesis C-methylase UbiE
MSAIKLNYFSKMTVRFNKPFEEADMDSVQKNTFACEIKELVDELTEKSLITTATGNLNQTNLTEGNIKYQYTLSPRRLWGYVKVLEACGIKSGMKVLDGGGASSPIVFYLGKKEIDITTLDLQDFLVENTKKVAKIMGWRSISAQGGDMTNTGFPDNYFDVVFSISVMQSLSNDLKIKAIKEFARILKPGGILGLVFDFGKSKNKKENYKYDIYDQSHVPPRSIEEIEDYIIKPSGLEIYGNKDLGNKIDPGKNYIRKTYRANFLQRKTFKNLSKFLISYFWSPYFNYTYYSIFFKKPMKG